MPWEKEYGYSQAIKVGDTIYVSATTMPDINTVMQIYRKVKPEITIVMVGRNPRYEIEIMIIQALEEESRLRYTDLREKISSRCQNLGLKKPSNDAFYSRLNNLCKRDVLVKEKDKYGARYEIFSL
ncbi:MAG TPA: hypothetical protein VJ729_02635 [Nitrososphaeraceae archaeon]|nr:hypothetical protein [Nitrososphaeraceae archaeon]